MYRIGELSKRVRFEREVRQDDGIGGYSKTWKKAFNCWAHVRPLRGGEREAADRVYADALYLCVIRFRRDVDERMRFVWDGVPYNIRSVKNSGYSEQYLEMEAERGVAQ